MGNVVNMRDYQQKLAGESSDAIRDGLIPIEFAMGMDDREQCLEKMAKKVKGTGTHRNAEKWSVR